MGTTPVCPDPRVRVSAFAKATASPRFRTTVALLVLVLSPTLAYADASLIDAVKSGDRAALRTLLQQKTDVNAPSADGTTALLWAAQLDDLETAQLLIKAGATARTANRYGVTPLQAAAVNGNATLMKALLAAGADANAVLPEGESVLMTAARTGRVEALTVLLDGGARVDNRENWFGETPLIWAAAEDHAAAVELLIRRGADVNEASLQQNLKSRRGGQSVLPLGKWTPLMYAARENALEAGRALVNNKADLNVADPDGATAIVIAILNANYDFAKLLLDAGADPNIVDTAAGMGPLYAAIDMHRLAVGHGRPNPRPSGALDAVDIVRELLEHKADPNVKLKAAIMQRQHTAGDSTLAAGATPLMRAAKSGEAEVVKLLLAGGADPTVTLANRTTPLMFAAGLGWRDGSPAAPSYDQGTPEEAVETIKLLIKAGIDINAANDAGDTALHAAVTGRASDVIVRGLVELGANLKATNKRNQTPLDTAMASRKDVAPIVELLKKYKSQP